MKRIYGVAYYPEINYDKKMVDNDIKHMKELGINTVRIGEFAWAKMEPYENKIDVSFFVNIIKKLYQNGINTIICTPTATPPIWMTDGHQERMYRDAGCEISHGARQHVCTNNPYFRVRAAIIIDAIAKAVKDLPGVIAWQLDNECKCNVAECYCEECEKQWHEWLEEKYTNIDFLNEQWCTEVWSQKYQNFEQIPTPLRATFAHNPSLSTDYKRFSFEKINDFLEIQRRIIRQHSELPITHNSGIYFQVDGETLFENLDFASVDDYTGADNFRRMIFVYDRYRSLKPNSDFMVMETSPGNNGWVQSYDNVLPGGYLAAEEAIAFGLGARGFSYWQYRQLTTGCEIPHGSILSAWGKPTYCYNQVKFARDKINELSDYLDSTTLEAAKIGIHYSDIGRAYMSTECYDGMNYIDLVNDFYNVFLNANIHRDVIPESADVSKYSLVLTPFLYYLSDELLNKMLKFVNLGGTWVIGPMTSIRGKSHDVHSDSALGIKLEDALGIKNIEMIPSKGIDLRMSYEGMESNLRYWINAFDVNGSDSLATVSEESYGIKKSVIAVNEYGNGKIIILGGMPNYDVLNKVLLDVAYTCGINSEFETSEGMIIIPRIDNEGNKSYLNINMNSKKGWIKKSKKGWIKNSDNKIEMEPYDIKITL